MQIQIFDPKEVKIIFGTSTIRDQAVLTDYLREVNHKPFAYIDCAWRYGNEALLGLSLKTLKREIADFAMDIEFQSKVWPTQFAGGIAKSLKFTLQKIGTVNAMGAYMLHRPHQDMHLNLTAWRQLIDCKKNRLTKKIGMAHFDKDLIEELFLVTGVRPEFLQVELSVNNMRYDRIHYCREKGIEIQSYDPLGDFEENLKNPLLIELSKKYNTTIRNLLLAFLMNQGIIPVVVPESVEDISKMLEARNIVISKEDLELMSTLNTYKSKHFETIELDFRDDK